MKQGTKIFLQRWLGLSCFDNPSLIKSIPSGSTFMKPSSVLNACKSLHLLNVDTAVRKTVFHVKHFKEILCIGSKGGLDKSSSTFFKSHSGTKRLTGGLELNTPFNRRVISVCYPIGVPSIFGNITDNIDLYPDMVLYLRPFWKRLLKKSAQLVKVAV